MAISPVSNALAAYQSDAATPAGAKQPAAKSSNGSQPPGDSVHLSAAAKAHLHTSDADGDGDGK